MSLSHVAFSVKTFTVFRRSAARWRQLMSHDGLDPEQVAALNASLMLEQVRFAMTHTRFYPRFYGEAGIEAGDLKDTDVLEYLPFVTKEVVRARADEFLTDEATPATTRRVATGGSTGEPLIMKRDARIEPRSFEWRLLSWWGVAPEVDTAIAYRFFRDQAATRKQQAVWWPSRRFQVDAFGMTPESMGAFLKDYARIRPGMIFGYVGAVLALARFVRQEGLNLPGSPVIATTAAPVTWEQRDEIEGAFGGRVYDHYRCAELNWIAGECRHRQGLHVFEDLKRVELVGGDGRPVPRGEQGEVVVTDFTNRVFPLIRYKLGDVSSERTDDCGCPLPYRRIDNVKGRVTQSVKLQTGEVIPGEALAQTFSKVAEAVRQFQIHQHADYSVSVRVIPRTTGEDPRILDAVSAVRRAVRGAVPVRLEVVDDLPHDGGKPRFVTSDVQL